jgi:transcriptional regulator GlxA family with amidase domain
MLMQQRQRYPNSTDSSIRDCGLKWGFHHMGRFSADYKQQFGESLSETLRGSR